MMKRVLESAYLLVLLAAPAFAQMTDNELAEAREMVQEQREQIIRDSLRLTPDEDAAFWPVYREYADDLKEVRDRRVALIADYLEAHESSELNDDVAREFLRRHLDVQSDTLKVRQRYVRRFQRVITAMKVTRFYQLENKLDAEVDIELAASVPLFDPM